MLAIWPFQLLPDEEIGNVIYLFDQKDVVELARTYRKYRVGPGNLSPCCAYTVIMEQTREAINQKFKRDVTNQET